MFHALARYDGFCADCHVDMPLVLLERGPRGLRAWLAGLGPDGRALTYTCRVCGRNEHVPLTEDADALYDLTLATWPDTVFPVPSYDLPEVEYADYLGADSEVTGVAEVAEAGWEPAAGDVFAQAALHLASAPVQAPAATVDPAPAATVERRVAERRQPLVRHIDALPRQRVHATDGLPLSLAVA